jgi:antitoxin HicB
MAKVVSYQQIEPREYSFTVVFEPLARLRAGRRNGRKIGRAPNPASPGYQVTVPLLPGFITYGRTLDEAREMARDAIKCHLEGLRKDGEPIPDENSVRKEKLQAGNFQHTAQL